MAVQSTTLDRKIAERPPASLWRDAFERLLKNRLAIVGGIFVVLLVLWLLGLVSSYTLGGFIHILLVVALAVLLINIIQGRRPVV
jgi:hypothetical protein